MRRLTVLIAALLGLLPAKVAPACDQDALIDGYIVCLHPADNALGRAYLRALVTAPQSTWRDAAAANLDRR